jgi:hypothetical protein
MEHRPQARLEGIISEPVEMELVIYDEYNRAAHALTRSAASVWEMCDGRHTIEQIAGALDLDLAVVERSVAELRERALLIVVAADGLSRRTALRRLAIAGGAAVTAAPLISTVVIPPASAAASTCSVVGQACTVTFSGTGCTGSITYDTCSFTPGCTCQGSCFDDEVLTGTCG